jgi:8-oxo-dGTP diphosphatase
LIRDAVTRALAIPWPRPVRGLLERLVMSNLLQRIFVPHFKVGVVGLIFNERGELLLFRHTYRHGYPWGLPSGFMEPGEQPAEALHREIGEEAGVDAQIDRVVYAYTDTKRALLNLVFFGSSSAGQLQPRGEISDAEYYALDALPLLLPDQKYLIDVFAQESNIEAAGIGPEFF